MTDTRREAPGTRHEVRSKPSRLTKFQWRASPHRMVVNLVRSGRKQPQLFFASDGVRLATPMKREAASVRHERFGPSNSFAAEIIHQ